MITLHHLEYSQSFRILWLLEELGAEYDLKIYNRDPETNLAPDDYKALSPLGTAPVITDGDLVLAESNSIIEYILDRHPENTLRPGPGEADRDRHLFWFHAAQASLMPIQLVDGMFTVIETRSPFLLRGLFRAAFKQVRSLLVQPRLTRLFEIAERDLGTAPWFGGQNLGAADIVLSYSMLAARDRGQFEDKYPNIGKWFERVEARPSFVAAREKDGRPSVAFSFDN